MRKRLALVLMWVYIRLIRSWTSPIMSFLALFRVTPNLEAWTEYKYLPAAEFEKKIRAVKYSGDPLRGLADYTISGPEYFWADGAPSIDCDDANFMWFLWAKENCDEAWLIVIMDGADISSAHYFTVSRTGREYHLCNYGWDRTTRKTLIDCVRQFSEKALVRHGIYHEPIVFVDKHWTRTKEEEV